MIYLKQKIKGLMLIKPEPFLDKRGLLRRIYCYKEFNLKKIKFSIKQANISENKNIQTLRGFHYQKFPYGEDKIISCIQGEIHNIVIDMMGGTSASGFAPPPDGGTNEANAQAQIYCTIAYLSE